MRTGIGIYVKNSVAAVELYKKAFGLELGYHVKNPDGSFYHSELCHNGTEIIDVIESAESDLKDNIVQVYIVLDTEAEVKKAYDLLSVDGTIEMPIGPLPWSPCAASIKDQFGVWWYISTPQHYPAEDFDPTKPLNDQR